MYKQFTPEAQTLMQLANKEALKRHHEYIGTEHILLAIINEGRCNAFKVLEKLDVSNCVRWDLHRIIINGPGEIAAKGRLPLTPRAKKAIEHATSWGMKRPSPQIDTDDLLFGLIEETEGVAAQVLMNHDVNVKTVRRTLKELGIRFQDDPPEQEDVEFRREISALKKALDKPDISDIDAIRMAQDAVYELWSMKVLLLDDDEDIEATL